MKLPQSLSAAALMARPIAAAKRACEVLEAMRQRDRLALSAAALVLIVGVDFGLVLPMRDKRVAIESAQLASSHDEEASRSSREAELHALKAALLTRQAQATKALAGFGAAGQRNESLRFLLSRTLQGLPVAVLSLRALGVEEMELAPAASEAGAATMPEAPASAAVQAGTAVPSLLYRHRYELRVGGELPALLVALEALEQNTRPLRIERVRLQADAHGMLQASVVLMTLGPERTWLSL